MNIPLYTFTDELSQQWMLPVNSFTKKREGKTMNNLRFHAVKKSHPLPFLLALFFLFQIILPCSVFSAEPVTNNPIDEVDWLADDIYSDLENIDIQGSYDPLEPLNRAFFAFNDKLYFWVLKPVNTGYRAVVAKDVRSCVANFFDNLKAPIYLLNNLIQGKFEDAGIVLARFAINTSFGVFGLGDPARVEFDLQTEPEDFGQTLGHWGVGEGLYICWPFFGPSNIRDTIGLLVDGYINPMSHLSDNMINNAGSYSADKLNQLSFYPNLYDDVKKYSLDPYVTMRQAFYDLRYDKIADIGKREKNLQKSASSLRKIENGELASW